MEPYLSIVAASRNDDHGGDMLRRMRIFLNGLKQQTRKFEVPVELIIVEWNPPGDRPFLSEVLPTPKENDQLTVRYIIVPSSIHRQYKRADVIPLFQMIAKNVGIRRANGQFVLCTNVDLLFSDGLFERIRQQQFQSQCFYRANRFDIPSSIDESWSIDKQLQFAYNNFIARIGRNPNYMNLDDTSEWIYSYKWLARFLNNAAGIKRKVFDNRIDMTLRYLETSACGDFTLMAKDAWLDIQGYPELDLYSIHVDTLGLIAAKAIGYEQVILPQDKCTYHIYHQTGWESMTPVEKIEFWEERPGIGWDVVFDSGMYLIEHGKRFNINSSNWGFADQDFEEVVYNYSNA